MDNFQSQRNDVVFPPPLERHAASGLPSLLPVSSILLQRPRRRKRGKRAGFLVLLCRLRKEADLRGLYSWAASGKIRLRLVGAGLIPTTHCVYHPGFHLKAWKAVPHRGRNPVLLHSLPHSTNSVPGNSTPVPVGRSVKWMLINACSIANKSYILNDLFCTKKLDFMFISETWQRENEVSHLLELCPADCSFLCAPRIWMRRWNSGNF